MNISCGVSAESRHSFYVLNDPCHDQLEGAKIPMTTVLYALLSGISMIIAMIVHFCYNSVTVLQYRLFVPAISNSLWVVYFAVVSIRAIVLSILYAKEFKSEGYFLTGWVFGSFEILMLCLALNYQRRFRSLAKVNVEPEDRTSELTKLIKTITIHEALLFLQFILVIIAIILFRFMNSNHASWFWVYVALSSLLEFDALVISVVIGFRSGYDQPVLITKLYFIGSVLLCIFEHIPMFVWENCASSSSCWSNHFDLFDMFIVFKIISVFCLFRALYKEYHRLKHECQYALLNEVQEYSFQ